MADHVTRGKRSAMMAAVHGKNTTPEIIVRKVAHRLGLRFRLHAKYLPGRPDLVFPRWSTVVFVNGCFWHRHPGCRLTTTPKSNSAFWKQKFAANIKRDAANYARLADLGWKVVILWQCEVAISENAESALKAAFPRRSN